MDVFDALRVIARWWFVALPMLVLSLVAAIVLSSGIAPEYQAEGSVLFVGPLVRESTTTPGETEAINPLLEQPSALTTAAVISSLSMSSPQVATILADEGLSTDYEVGVESRTPILLLLVRADSRDLATATALRLAELVDDDVRLRQEAADVPLDQRVTTNVIGLSAVGGADYGGRNRIRLAVFILGAGTSFGLAFLLEGLRNRRAAAPGGSKSDDATAADDDAVSLVEV